MNKVLLKSDFDYDFILLAISCPLKDYRICHFINKFSGLEFEKAKDYILQLPPYSSVCRFSTYRYFIEQTDTEFYLIANKGEEEGLLIPEMRNTDYFIIIKGFIDEEDLTGLIDAINAVPEVVVASEITPEKLKSRENLIF